MDILKFIIHFLDKLVWGWVGMTQNMDMTAMAKICNFYSFMNFEYDTNIICLPTKNMQFCKIKRLWLKNWACHAHLKFKIQKGVAS